MTEESKKAFDFAADTVKQLITLATGIIAITITFSKDIIGASMLTNSTLIFISWGLFILSIFFGILALLALTGTLDPISQANPPISPSINRKSVRNFSLLQIATFIGGLILTVIFGATSIKYAKLEKEDKEGIQVLEKTEYKILRPQKSQVINYLDSNENN
ncbi:hypothetical protein [Chryseobacterium gleum]|uniref:hypothetical protein n=1 Tax=Chryseobacterium gleum TaxID=250 RepID=UPI0028A7A546|nr:hypothetical protein [Chryseobacterium gleum]